MQSVKSNVMILLMVFHMLLAFSHFDSLQILVEIALIIWFSAGLLRARFQVEEVLLIIVYLIALTVSFYVNEPTIALLGGKIMGLGILSILYFSRHKLEPGILSIIFIINCLLVITWKVTGINLGQSMADQAGGSWSDVNGRPLGLFMSAHISAYFSAIFLIYYLHRVRSYGLGIFLIWTTTSVFTLVAYSSQIFVIYAVRHVRRILYILCIGLCFVLILGFIEVGGSGESLLKFFLEPISSFFSPDRIKGFGIIFGQVFNYQAWDRVLTIFPSDYRLLLVGWIDQWGNELMWFTYMQHAGAFLLAAYSWILFRRIRFYVIFSIVGLLHYGDITSPLFIYMMITYSGILQNREKRLESS